MKASDCYIGMRTTLPMSFRELEDSACKPKMEQATCIWIHPQKRYALFRCANGIRITVDLENEVRLAKNAANLPVDTSEELVTHKSEHDSNNARIRNAATEEHVSMAAVSIKAGHDRSFLSRKMMFYELDDDETAYWLKLIHQVAQETNTVLDERDPYYLIKKALKDCDLSLAAAGRLCGRSNAWLFQRMKRPMEVKQQREIADEIRTRAKMAAKDSQSGSMN